MYKKILCFSIILFISIALFYVSYATDVLMDLEDTNSNSVQITDNTTYTADNATTYAPDNNNTTANQTTYNDYETVATTTTTDYEDSTELSISNMINIILIVVGIVLVLLGAAIIIKLK